MRTQLKLFTFAVALLLALVGAGAHAYGQAGPLDGATKAWSLQSDFDGDNVPSPGDVLRYTIQIPNTGDETIDDVIFADFPEPTVALETGSVTTTHGRVIKGNGAGDTSVIVEVGSLDPGETARITFDVRICVCLQGPTEVVNQGLVNAPGIKVPTDDPSTPELDDPTVTPVDVPGASEIGTPAKTWSLQTDADGGGQPSPGDTLRYTVNIPNVGQGPARDLVFFDAPDPSSRLVTGSVTTTHGTVTSGNRSGDQTVVVVIENLAAGASATVRFDVTLNANASGEICNQGFVKAPQGELPTDDPDTPDEDDCTETPVNPPETPELGTPTKQVDLVVDADGGGAPSPGDTLRYTIRVPNVGQIPVEDVTFSDVPDPQTRLVIGSVTTTHGTVTRGNQTGQATVEVEIGTLPVGQTAVIRFDVTIREGATGTVANQGIVETPDGEDPTDDPDTPDEDDPTETPVEPKETPELGQPTKQASVQIDADGSGGPSVGDTVRYTIRVPNVGQAIVNDLTFTDTPDPNTQLVVGSVTTSHGTVTAGNAGGDTAVEVAVPTLGVGQTLVIRFDVVVLEGAAEAGQIANQGIVSTPPDDDTPGGDIPTDDPDTPDEPGDETETPVEPKGPPVTPKKQAAVIRDADGSGGPSVGDTVRYTITLPNVTGSSVAEVVFRDTPDEATRIVPGSVRASRGRVVLGNEPGHRAIRVDVGALPVGQSAEITFDVIVSGEVAQVVNQGIVETPEGEVPTDDPDTEAPDDETVTPLGPRVSIPVAICEQPPKLEALLSSTTFLIRFQDRSTDADNDILTRLWDFGDGTTCSDDHTAGCSVSFDGKTFEGDVRSPVHIFKGQGRFVTTLTVTDSQGHSDTTACPFTYGDPPIETVLDANANHVLDDAEVLRAIDLWVTGTPVPNTNGKLINDRLILTLIDKWIQGAPIGVKDGSN